MRAPLPIRAVRATFAFSQTYAQTRREARRVPRVQHAVALHLPSRSNHVGRLVCGVYYRGADHCPVGIFWERGPCVCLSCLTIADIVHDTRSFAMLLGAAIAGKASTVALEYYRKGGAGRSFSALTQKFPRNLVLCLSLWSAHAADTWSITLSRTDWS